MIYTKDQQKIIIKVLNNLLIWGRKHKHILLGNECFIRFFKFPYPVIYKVVDNQKETTLEVFHICNSRTFYADMKETYSKIFSENYNLALSKNCGSYSIRENKCYKCKKKLPKNILVFVKLLKLKEKIK